MDDSPRPNRHTPRDRDGVQDNGVRQQPGRYRQEQSPLQEGYELPGRRRSAFRHRVRLGHVWL